MKAIDFEYDGFRLSDFGCIICTFDDPGVDNYSVGSEISYNLTPVYGGRINYLTGISYKNCITGEFQICKNKEKLFMDDASEKYFTLDEQCEITRWLNRPEFLPLAIYDDNYEGIFFEGSFNVEKIEIAGNVVGFNLSFSTNKPFAQYQTMMGKYNVTAFNSDISIIDISDEIGYIYPSMEITCNSSGDLTIYNSMDGRTTSIKNCVEGEVITMADMIIESSDSDHNSNIMNDFNFNFVRLSNTFKDRKNVLTFSLPCSVVIKYTPLRKVGI